MRENSAISNKIFCWKNSENFFEKSVDKTVFRGYNNQRRRSKRPKRHTKCAAVAHLVERHLAKVEVASSSLVGRSICGSLAQLGEHLPYKQRVSGSSPLTPTKYGPVVQLVRTLACHARGRRFEPVPGRHFFIKTK